MKWCQVFLLDRLILFENENDFQIQIVLVEVVQLIQLYNTTLHNNNSHITSYLKTL